MTLLHKMHFIIILLFLLHIVHVYSDTEELPNLIEDSSHEEPLTTNEIEDNRKYLEKGRFLTFNKEANKIRVEAAFAVPFLTIPVGRDLVSNNAALSIPKVDVNLKAIAVIAGIFTLLFLVIPKLLHIYMPTVLKQENSSPILTGDPQSFDTIMSKVFDAFDKYDMDVTSCARKAMCLTIKNAASKVKQGSANGIEKLVDALASMQYLKYFIQDTWLWKFLETTSISTHNGNDRCEIFNKKCVISGDGLNREPGSLIAYRKN